MPRPCALEETHDGDLYGIAKTAGASKNVIKSGRRAQIQTYARNAESERLSEMHNGDQYGPTGGMLSSSVRDEVHDGDRYGLAKEMTSPGVRGDMHEGDRYVPCVTGCVGPRRTLRWYDLSKRACKILPDALPALDGAGRHIGPLRA